MKTSKLHTVLQKSLRIIFLLFVFSLGANVALGQAQLLIPNGNANKEDYNDPPGGKWSPDGKSSCTHLKQRLSYLCGGNDGSSKFMISFQRISKEEGEIEIAKGQGIGWNYRTCLSISYNKDWMTDNPSKDRIDNDYPDIVYAYSVGSKTEGFNVYYYVSDDKSPTPTNNDDNIKPLLDGDAQNLFQNGNLPSQINGSKDPLLQTLDLSGWDFSGVTSLVRFFSNAKRLTNVTFGETVNLSKLTNVYKMFDGCPENKVKTYFSDFISTWVVDVAWDDVKKEFVTTNNFSDGNTELLTNKSGKQIENNIVTTKNDIEFKIKKVQANNCALVNQDRPIGEFTSKISSAWIDTISDEIYISWDILYEQKIKKFVLEYSIDGGETYYEIDEIAANSQNDAAYVVAGYSYKWEIIPLDFLRAKEYKIRIKMMTTEDNEIDEAFLLPIELTYFEVLQNGNELFFEWETATETNNDYFTIEQSIDGISFREVAQIAGAGTTSWSNSYNYIVPANYNGLRYFRLKQTDYNGDYSYSDVQSVFVDNNEYVRLYPTVASDYITIDGDFESVEFSDSQGVIHHPTRMEGNSFPISTLPKGMHFAIISLKNGEIVTRQFIRK